MRRSGSAGGAIRRRRTRSSSAPTKGPLSCCAAGRRRHAAWQDTSSWRFPWPWLPRPFCTFVRPARPPVAQAPPPAAAAAPPAPRASERATRSRSGGRHHIGADHGADCWHTSAAGHRSRSVHARRGVTRRALRDCGRVLSDRRARRGSGRRSHGARSADAPSRFGRLAAGGCRPVRVPRRRRGRAATPAGRRPHRHADCGDRSMMDGRGPHQSTPPTWSRNVATRSARRQPRATSRRSSSAAHGDWQRRSVRPLRRQRIEDVDDAHDLREQRDGIAAQPVRVAAPVQPFVVMANDRAHSAAATAARRRADRRSPCAA